ncbi:MAG: hypothetical protein QG570_702 [Patescibacteria group bacterium]|nr:hypothetical protein [Patescibacteria group bacterium]
MMKFKNLLFYVVISIALILSPALLFRSMFPAKALAFNFFGYVLGDDDEAEEDEEDDDEDENEDERNDKDEDEEDDKDEADDNEEDEKDDERKETRSTKVNQDGTRTVTKKKVEDNGKVEIETKTYGINGKVIEEYKSKDENGKSEEEYQAKVFSEEGGKVSEIKYKSKNGEEFRLMIKNEDQSITKVKYDENHNYVRVIGRTNDNDDGLEDELQNEIEDESEMDDDSVNDDESETDDDVLIRSEDDETYELEHRGKKVRVRLPLTIDDATGDILLLTDSGEKSLQYLPDAILSKVSESDDSIEVSNVEIVEKDGKIAYELTAEKAQSVLGLFKTRIDTLITYDAETGQELESLQSFWGRIVDAISF